MAGEPEAAALGVTQAHALHGECGRRAFGLSLAQWFSPRYLVRGGSAWETAALRMYGCQACSKGAEVRIVGLPGRCLRRRRTAVR
ncbi:hypothetical protein GCM10012287_19990 [Streptomyces daqingensis]|uniref:Uncharacterized protein n=1 Tax=Streptomyces daqingensis TaxID=1472640 RepID=A0ABQ2M6F0_9ACTN|nr:hypothetical protein GCM10012287_19990 [Streptomyces daqingensis]